MTTNNDALREASEEALRLLELLHPLTCHNAIVALRAALAASKPEPQAQEALK